MTTFEIIVLIFWILKLGQWALTFIYYWLSDPIVRHLINFRFNWSDHLTWVAPVYLWVG